MILIKNFPECYFNKFSYKNMDNNMHFGARFIFIHGQEGLFDSFKNILYGIS
jgi:hypothetical protein